MFEKYDRIVELYMDNMERNELSPDSVASYGGTFRRLRESMERNGFEDICTEAVVSFKLESEAKITSLALYLTHIRCLSAFAVSCGLVDEPFFRDTLKPPKKKLATERQKPYEHVLTDKDADMLIHAERPTFGRKPQTWLREKAEVTLLIQSGLRNSELRSLCPCDLDWENGVAYPQKTKGDKPRAVVFSDDAKAAVREYLESGLRPADAGDDEPLFGCVGADGTWHEMDRKKLSERIKYYTKAVLGEEKACRTHAARHCYASILLENNVPMDLISETMGHSSVATTKIYAARFNVAAPAMAIANVFNRKEAVTSVG